MAYTTEELGRLIARAHYQAWRLDAPPFDLTPEELAAILPNLIKSGSAGIVWHRVKPFREKYGAMAYALEAATEAQIAHNQRVEEAVVECVTRLRAYGIEPVLVKGLALAKLYPEGIVRPAGDIDLVVRKEEFAAAHAILHDSAKPRIPIEVDLKHPGNWMEAPSETVWQRLLTTHVGGHHISTLDPTDNLRMLCFHYWKDRGHRPLWVTDVALAGEFARDSLDPERLVAGDDFDRDRVLSLIALCELFLGLDWAMSLEGFKQPTIPKWLLSAVLGQWADPKGYDHDALREFFESPMRLGQIIANRWTQPIHATVYTRARFDDSPRWRLQLMSFAHRLWSWPTANLARQWRHYLS